MKSTRIVEYKYTFNGADLAQAREALGLSQADLARITGIQRQNISAMERPAAVTIRELTKQALEKAGIMFTNDQQKGGD